MQTPRPRCGQTRKCDDMKVGRNCGQTRKCDDTNVGRNKTKGMTQQDESKFKKQGLTTPNLLGKIPYHSTKGTGTERKQLPKEQQKIGTSSLDAYKIFCDDPQVLRTTSPQVCSHSKSLFCV